MKQARLASFDQGGPRIRDGLPAKVGAQPFLQAPVVMKFAETILQLSQTFEPHDVRRCRRLQEIFGQITEIFDS